MKQIKPRRFVALSAIAYLPVNVYAEPSVSSAHMPFLWAVVIAGVVLFAMSPFVITKQRTYTIAKWIAAIILGLVFLIIVGPIIFVLGSILITGRTM